MEKKKKGSVSKYLILLGMTEKKLLPRVEMHG